MSEEMIDLGYGIKISKDMKAKMDLGYQMAAALQPQFEAEIRTKTVPELKALVRKFRSTKGMTVKSHFIDALLSWHTGECLKAAGYKANPNTFGPRLSGRS